MGRIYLSPPHVGGRERELLLDALDSGWIAPLGPHVDAFEREFAANIGVGHAAALSSGTAALHLALVLLNVGPGDYVITSTLTFAATVNAIRYVGATPVFIDSEEQSWNLDPSILDAALNDLDAKKRNVAAVVAVDIYGQCADYTKIAAVCAEHGIPLIEDAAEALGATHAGKPAGSFGRMGVFSFNGNKIITTSGGGMLVADDPELIAKARFLASQARDPAPHYEHSTVGYNYRMSNLLAAVGRGQLERLDERVRQRRAVNQAYREALADIDGIRFMPEAPRGCSTHWLTVIRIAADRFGIDRNTLHDHLQTHDIEARPTWKPMHRQPVFSEHPYYGGAVADGIFADGLCLPSGSNLGAEDMARIVDAIHAARGGR